MLWQKRIVLQRERIERRAMWSEKEKIYGGAGEMDAMLKLVSAPAEESKARGTEYTPAEIYQQPPPPPGAEPSPGEEPPTGQEPPPGGEGGEGTVEGEFREV